MKKFLYSLFFIALITGSGQMLCFSWGFYAHKKINRLAVFTLPPGMISFYKTHIDYISEEAVAPDHRRYSDKEEAPRHFIDIDHYGDNPFEVMPRRWKEAVAKYTEDTLLRYGIVPWHIAKVFGWLTDAFKENNPEKILFLSANLGHYIADAHVPLHCTVNYNGQLTNQQGIHGFWESRLPELMSGQYDLFTGRAEYIENPLETAWTIIEESFAAKDSVLQFEATLNERFAPDKKFTYLEKGKTLVKNYSEEYAKQYHDMLNGMVERRMRAAISAVGSYWYSAWVNAGKPDIMVLESNELSKQLESQLKDEENLWKTGNPKEGDHDE